MNTSMKSNKQLSTALTYVVLILGSIIMIFPFVWMILTAFKTQAEAMAIPPQILPSSWNFDNFVTALESLPFVNLYVNTGLLILFRVLCAVIFSSMAGYAFAKLQFPCKNLLFGIVLVQMMQPKAAEDFSSGFPNLLVQYLVGIYRFALAHEDVADDAVGIYLIVTLHLHGFQHHGNVSGSQSVAPFA